MALLKGNQDSERYTASTEDAASMGEYVQSAMQAGWLLATDDLRPSSRATRVQLSNGRPTLIDPFTESTELIARYALLAVRSRRRPSNGLGPSWSSLGGGEIDLWRYAR